MPRKREFSVPLRVTIPGHDQEDAVKQAQDALAEGLIEPGFIKDGAVDEGPIFELEAAPEE